MLIQRYNSDIFPIQDEHLLFFLRKSLKETISIGANWMVHTAPWEKILDNPKWPADIKNSNVKAINNNSRADIDDSDDDFDEGDVDLSLSDLEFEEDEVDGLLKMME